MEDVDEFTNYLENLLTKHNLEQAYLLMKLVQRYFLSANRYLTFLHTTDISAIDDCAKIVSESFATVFLRFLMS